MSYDISRSNIAFWSNTRGVAAFLVAMLLAMLTNGDSAEAQTGGADPRVVAKQILEEVIPELTNTMASMSQGCSGGPNGMPPLNWQERQKPGNAAVEAFSLARAAMGEGRTGDAKKQITSGIGQWDTLVGRLKKSCEGGRDGMDPVNYKTYVSYRDVMKERFETVLRFL